MENSKKYYWLKLKEDFFDDKVIRYLRRLPEGSSLVIIYLKMQLKSLKTEGFLKYDGIMPTYEEELALVLDENPMLVTGAINALEKMGVVERWENDTLYMAAMQELIGTETAAAARVRRHREMKRGQLEAAEQNRLPAKTNAERQAAFKAKKACEEIQYIPLIDDHMNSTRYGGNYYVVMKRDHFKCAMCGSIENICVHHIDGFDENKPLNNAQNKLLVLCRRCHSNLHSSNTKIPHHILQSIGYLAENGMSNENCNAGALQNCVTVTNCNTEIEIDIREELEIREDIEGDEEEPPDFRPTTTSAPYEQIKSLYNSICISLSKCTAMSDQRKKAIKARMSSGYTLDDFKRLFEKAQASSFLKGRNDRNWRATFDWLICDANMAKTLDGNYDDQPIVIQPPAKQPQQPKTFRDMLNEAEAME